MRLPARLALALLMCAAGAAAAQPPAKKPLTQDAFDQWRSIRGARLSSDGRWVIYSLVPQVGDGEVVVRDIPNGRELRHTRGFIARPQNRAGAAGGAGSFPDAQLTSDARFAVFTIEPARSEVERAQRERKRPAEQPRTALGIMSTADGKVTTIPAVKSFRLAGGSSRYLVYHAEPRDTAASAQSGASTRGRNRIVGTPLVLRELATGKETTIGEVTSYLLDGAGRWLVYTVTSRTPERDGAYARSLTDGQTITLLAGEGSYRALTLDASGTQVAFLSDRGGQSREKPRFTLYHASLTPSGARRTSVAVNASEPQVALGKMLVDPAALGDTLLVATAGRIEFSDDGALLQFGIARPPVDPIPADSLADKAVFDLWHWKDARLQPQQRLDAWRDRERAYSAVYKLDSGQLRVLGTDSIPQLRFSRNGRIALAFSSAPYAIEAMWGEGGSDVYVVDVATGQQRLVKERAPFGATLSPTGKYVLYFGADAHWYSYNVATGRTADLTGSITGVSFERETWDEPSTPPAWGVGGWTRGDRSVLLYDQYDIWEVDPTGERAPRVVTDSVGRSRKITFRIAAADSVGGAIDPARPLLLSAVDEETKASGFWRDRLDAPTPPMELVMAERKLTLVGRASGADVVLFTQSTFQEFPDLWVANGSFEAPVKISHANPQQANYKWGTAELVSWLSDDGVPLKGILYKPEDFDPNRQYPMVVYFYEKSSGLLHSHIRPSGGNVINPTVYVSNDYLVFEPDIVYQTGHPGASAYKAIVPGVQTLIARGFVNPKAIGLQGQSWGGYQVTYLITQTSLFRAAMAGAPVVNMTSAYGGIRWQSGMARPFQYERTQSRIGGSIWEYPMRFLENSPLFAADRVGTPLLIMSNDGDGAVPWYQGIEMFIALRRLQKEVYLINYNGDGHNPTKRANQLDIAMRMQQFFDHHLKGDPAPEWMVRGIPYLEKGRDQLNRGTPPPTVAAAEGAAQGEAASIAKP